jgi:hypothetical protein
MARGQREAPPVRPATVEAMLTAASEAAMARFEELEKDHHPRFPDPAGWRELRRFFHGMRDEDRRAAALRLLGEEAERLARDRGADLGRIGVRDRGDGA